MRRSDREVTDPQEIAEIIRKCQVCRLGLEDNGSPYIVPMNFGFTLADGELTFYFHCAREGRKLEILRRNPAVCFELDCDGKVLYAQDACQTGFAYASVIGMGTAAIVTEPEEKLRALDCLMEHYTEKTSHTYREASIAAITILRVKSHSFTGKRLAPPPKPETGLPELCTRAGGPESSFTENHHNDSKKEGIL